MSLLRRLADYHEGQRVARDLAQLRSVQLTLEAIKRRAAHRYERELKPAMAAAATSRKTDA